MNLLIYPLRVGLVEVWRLLLWQKMTQLCKQRFQAILIAVDSYTTTNL